MNNSAVANEACSNRSLTQQWNGAIPARISTASNNGTSAASVCTRCVPSAATNHQPTHINTKLRPMCRANTRVGAPRERSSKYGGSDDSPSKATISHGSFALSKARSNDCEISDDAKPNRRNFVRNVVNDTSTCNNAPKGATARSGCRS